MKRKPVSSSSIKSVGYNAAGGTLEVEFRHGGIYQYYDVPQRCYLELLNAESLGAYYQTFIKKPGYSYRKVD